ncbi:unnamed protein product [Closterium sp. NIES-54]
MEGSASEAWGSHSDLAAAASGHRHNLPFESTPTATTPTAATTATPTPTAATTATTKTPTPATTPTAATTSATSTASTAYTTTTPAATATNLATLALAVAALPTKSRSSPNILSTKDVNSSSRSVGGGKGGGGAPLNEGSLPPLPPSPAPPCLPCVEGRQRATPHSSLFPSMNAPLQTLHMDVWGPAHVSKQGRKRYFLLVVDDYTRYTLVFPLRSKDEVPDVLIPWIRGVRLQLRERFRQELSVLRLHSDRGGEFSSDLLQDFCRGEGILQSFTLPASPQKNGVAERHTGLFMEVARTSMIHAAAPHFLWPFAVRYAAHQLNLWPRVSLPENSHTLRWTGKVGDASVFQVWGSRTFVRDTSADKLSSHAVPCVDPLPLAEPVEVAVDSGAAGGGSAKGAVSGGAEPVGAEPGGAEPASAEPGGPEPEGADPEGAETEGVEPGGVESEGADSGGAEPRGTASAGGAGGPAAGGIGAGGAGATSRGVGVTTGAGVTGGAGSPGPGGARTRGTGVARASSVGDARAGGPRAGGTGAGGAGAGDHGARGTRAGDPGARGAGAGGAAGDRGAGGARAGGAGAGGTGAGDPGARGTGAGDPRAGGAGAGGAGAGGAGAGGTAAGGAGTGGDGVGGAGAGGTGAGGAGAGDPGAGGVGAGGAGAGGTRARGTVQRRPFFVPPPPSSLPPPGSVLCQVLSLSSSTGLTPRFLCPPPHQSQPQLQPDSPLPAPSPYAEKIDSLTESREPASRPALPVRAVCTGRRVPRPCPPPVRGIHIMTLRPSSIPLRAPLPSPPASSLADGPDPESDLVRAASPSITRLLGTVVTDPSFDLVAESESDCLPCVGGECALGADVLEDMQEDFECLATAVPHLVAMLLSPEGDTDAPDIPTLHSYAEAIMCPYSSQWQTAMDTEMASSKSTSTYVDAVPPPWANIGVDFFQTFSPTPKMTTLRELLHVAAQRDNELHSLDFSIAFSQGDLAALPTCLHWVVSCRTTLAALGFTPSTADQSLFLHTDTSLPPFYVIVYVDNLVFATADTEALSLVKSGLEKRHICTDLGELCSYLGLQITRDRAWRTITLTQSHMVHQVLQRFGFRYSSPQSTPLPTGHSLSAPPSDKSVEPSGPHRPEHWEAAKRVLRYLCSTSVMGLMLGGRGPVVLTGHADASWVDDLATQRSS